MENKIIFKLISMGIVIKELKKLFSQFSIWFEILLDNVLFNVYKFKAWLLIQVLLYESYV